MPIPRKQAKQRVRKSAPIVDPEGYLASVRQMEVKERFLYFVKERHAIYVRRFIDKKPKPWTNDPILQQYRFCNVYRELDTVTKWIADNWRDPNEGQPDLWFAMAVARWNNWPDTLDQVGFPLPWSPLKFERVLKDRARAGEKVWTGAYLIGTQGNAKDKAAFIAQDVLTPLWEQRAELRPRKGDTLESFARRIENVKNQGRFMVGQIVADIKYDKLSPLYYKNGCKDWWTFAMPGPGSCRGVNRIYGTEFDRGMTAFKERQWHKLTLQLRDLINNELVKKKHLPEEIHAADVNNCCCEWDKYERTLWEEGRPRAGYPGI